MFKVGYETFVNHPDELLGEKELELEIRDCKQYRTMLVKALVSLPAKEMADGEQLWVRGNIGHLVSEVPWKIKVTKVIQER